MGVKTFKEIIAWQYAHKLVLQVYKIAKDFPDYEKFGLGSQIRRSAISVPSNIAEGFKRTGIKDSIRFYNIAEGSLEELKYQILLTKDLGYITDNIYEEMMVKAEKVGKTLSGWISSHQ